MQKNNKTFNKLEHILASYNLMVEYMDRIHSGDSEGLEVSYSTMSEIKANQFFLELQTQRNK